MLTRLHLQNFTVFADADFHFSPGLNVLVGTNGTGKSHVLKVGYAVGKARESPFLPVGWEKYALVPLFLPSDVSNLVRRGAAESAVIEGWSNKQGDAQMKIVIHSSAAANKPKGSLNSVSVLAEEPESIFIPPKEVLSIYYGFISLYDKREVDYDITYPELCKQLSTPLLRKVDESVADALAQLQAAMGGTVKIEGNRFVFVPTGSTDGLPINLYAEGLRKFGTLWQLLRNGSLTPETTLFWDEPEANLNPALLKKLAAVLAALARQGFQIILATHSLFLLKELHILSRDKQEKALPIRYFGLNADPAVPGSPTRVTTVDDFELLPDIVALDVELQQSDELTRVFAEDDDAQLPAADAHAD